MMIKWMKNIKAMPSPEGVQHENNVDLPSGSLERKLMGEGRLEGTALITPSYPTIQLEPH